MFPIRSLSGRKVCVSLLENFEQFLLYYKLYREDDPLLKQFHDPERKPE